MLPVEIDVVEVHLRSDRSRRAGDEELLRSRHLVVAEDVPGQMQLHLGPHADGKHRHFDPLQVLRRGALLPILVVIRVVLHVEVEVLLQDARVVAVRRVQVRHAHARVEPVQGEVALDPAAEREVAVGVVHPVIEGEACQVRRVLYAHEPLRHAVIRLPDSGDLAVRPFLSRDPFDDVVEVLLLRAGEETELAARDAGSAHVGVHVNVALLDVPFDGAGLAPQEHRPRRQLVVVVAVGRSREERGKRPAAFRPIDAHADLHAVPHRDLHVFFLDHAVSPFSPITYSSATSRTAGAFICTKFSSSLRIIAGTGPPNIARMSSAFAK